MLRNRKRRDVDFFNSIGLCLELLKYVYSERSCFTENQDTKIPCGIPAPAGMQRQLSKNSMGVGAALMA